jgi:putative protease
VAAEVQDAVLEFFVHGALCVAYSGNCSISHAHTGRSANRGSCSQECRLPYTVLDAQGRVVAHQQHVLSLKDNDQSANLRSLVDAGIRSFKIEGRYKDMATVKNLTAHYRQLLDAVLEERSDLRRSSWGRCRTTFSPDPARGFHRGSTDYFVNGRREDIGAFDTPKHAGMPLGQVLRVAGEHFDLELDPGVDALNNGDSLTWFDLQGELQGVPVNVAQPLGGRAWRAFPNAPVAMLKDLRRGTVLQRNRDMAWERLLAAPSAERRIGVALRLSTTRRGLLLELRDEAGRRARAEADCAPEAPRDAAQAERTAREQLARLGGTRFEATEVTLAWDAPRFVPASVLNTLRRDGIAALEAAQAAAFERLPRGVAVEPPVAYPEETLSFLANVYNHRAAAFYARHGVKLIAPAFESHEELGEVPLMITKHCVRFSLSLCPKQAKGVTGVQGTVKAEPLVLVNGNERLTLKFDCKPCEMHVVGRIRKQVLRDSGREQAAALAAGVPIRFYKTRPGPERMPAPRLSPQ